MFQGAELEDDDDGSTTVTNSTANLAEQATPVLAKELVAKLESITATLIEEEDESSLKPPAEEPSITPPPPDIDDLVVDPLSHSEPAAGSGTTNSITNPVCVDQKTATGTGLEIVVEDDETSVRDDFPPQGDSEQDIEPWIPDGKIPTIVISPPSEVDPEDYAQQFYWEQEQEEPEAAPDSYFEDDLEPEDEESEYNGDSEVEYTDDYPIHPVTEVVPEPPSSPVEVRGDRCHSPYHSPIIATGVLWSDTKSDGPGPLPFTEEAVRVEATNILEAQVSTVEGGALETIAVSSEELSGMRFAHPPPYEVC